MGSRRSAARAALMMSVSVATIGALCSTRASAQDESVQVDEVVVTGTRRAGVTLTESSTPVDVVSGETLQRQGASDLNDALKTTVVSLNVQNWRYVGARLTAPRTPRR